MHLRERTLVHGVLPPAPLASLSTAFSRRAALFGAVSATGFLVAAGAAAMGQEAETPPSALDPAETQLFADCSKLHALDAAIEAMCDAHQHVDCEAMPFELRGRRLVALFEIVERPAVTLAGVAAKARVLFTDDVQQDVEWAERLSTSIADDVLSIHGGARV